MIELGIPLREIVASRKRNAAWANPVEPFLVGEAEEFLAAMVIEYDDLTVECTDLICELAMVITPDSAEETFARMQAFPAPMQAPFGEILDDGRHRVGMRLLYDSDWGTAETFRNRHRALAQERFPEGLSQLRDYFANGGTVGGDSAAEEARPR